jgi:RND family efflux transporter MFP subunit
VTQNRSIRIPRICSLLLVGLAATGCQKKQSAPAGPQPQGLPVQTVTVAMEPVPQTTQYVATIKSRRSATLQPQVNGALVSIRARSGDHVRAGQTLMEIDPRQQQATVAAQRATERQKKALYDYDTVELDRQRQLFQAGVTSRDAWDQAQQAFQNAKADYESALESRRTQEQLLAYYTIRAPFDGIVGDIPVHVGDYVTTSTVLTTVDENADLEAYIYIPTERSSEVHVGLPVNLTDNNGKLLEKTKIDFVSPQVDSSLQEILAKAPVHATPEMVRNAQMVKANVIWSTKPMAVVPVLAVAQQGEQSFVFVLQQQNGMALAHRVPVILGSMAGNNYSIISGLNPGDQVIVSATQFLVDGMPVIPMGGPPQAPPPQGKSGAGHANALVDQGSSSAAGPKNAASRRRTVSHHPHRKHRKALARKNRQTKRETVS